MARALRVLDLFSGIGGFSLGLERAGMQTVGFCEIDPFCRAVLAKHWPNIPCSEDITKRDFTEGEADIICGGFPCQDISFAGAGAGLAGERSGLWRELVRAIRLVRPRYAIVENVAALLSRGLGTVLGDLASIGYDAEWHCIPASAVGAWHERDRVWVIANANDQWQLQSRGLKRDERGWSKYRAPKIAAHALLRRLSRRDHAGACREDARNLNERLKFTFASADDFAASDWSDQPLLGREIHGIPQRVDRIEALGNAVVPQIPEIIGRAILAQHESTAREAA